MDWRPELPPQENSISRCRAFYRCTKQRLRQASIDFVPIDSRWGYLIRNTVNGRTGSEFHSPHEAMAMLSRLKTG